MLTGEVVPRSELFDIWAQHYLSWNRAADQRARDGDVYSQKLHRFGANALLSFAKEFFPEESLAKKLDEFVATISAD